ncbi:MAG: sugar phosphate nucleotidyltransferase, partial [Planctomycetota bacterium]|nr:sugar phosphate nucleotidyltransferase [Planctomycetota bacterium]
HIYRMDYAAMLDFHKANDAELTIACMEVSLEDARGFGVMETGADSRIVAFEEKPRDPKPIPGSDSKALASMGIYIFNKQLLADELLAEHANKSSEQDFGKNVIPRLIHKNRVVAYPFGGEAGRVKPDNYWRDVGTLDSYYESNMELLSANPPMDLYQPDWAIHSHLLQAPPACVVGDFGRDSDVDNVIMGGGAAVRGSSVRHTVLSGEVTVLNSNVTDSILCGDIVVGEGCELRRCIVDKHVRIPPGTKIGVESELDARFTVSPDGIVVVPRGYFFRR